MTESFEAVGKQGIRVTLTPILKQKKRGVASWMEFEGYRAERNGETHEFATLEDALDWIDTLKRR